jgi:hypothetical protein
MTEDERDRRDREWRDQVLTGVVAAKAARQHALVGQEDLVAQVEVLLFRHDPIGIDFGTNTDEYRSEAETIVLRLPELASEAALLEVVHQESVHWFGAPTAGQPSRYRAISAELWALLRERGTR